MKNRLLRGALMLTFVNLLLRLAQTSFQVWLSGRIGAAGLGLLQLVLSVNMLALTAGGAGGRTAAMYLTAAQLGRGNRDHADRLLGGCFVYCICCSGAVGALLFLVSPRLAQDWIGSMDALSALRTWAAFVPVLCLTGVMTGYFTAANRIGTLAAVEVAEQLCSIAITVAALACVDPSDHSGSCRAVVLGNCLGSALTLTCLMALYAPMAGSGNSRIPVAGPILRCALPLAVTDDLKAGVSALENLMVPRRLALYRGLGDPLAAFGRISGMVFPVVMFPSAILSSLAEVLIPELARCTAVRSHTRIRYLVRRNLRLTLLYGLLCGGMIALLAENLSQRLYPGQDIAPLMRRFALMLPMLYCDLISDAMLKGLGQQAACARYSIIANLLDIGMMYFLLPLWGVDGYCLSFFLTHGVNFGLGLRRLLKTAGVRVTPLSAVLPLLCALLALLGGSCFQGPIRRIAAFLGLLFSLSVYTGAVRKSDLRWLYHLIFCAKKPTKTADATNS